MDWLTLRLDALFSSLQSLQFPPRFSPLLSLVVTVLEQRTTAFSLGGMFRNKILWGGREVFSPSGGGREIGRDWWKKDQEYGVMCWFAKKLDGERRGCWLSSRSVLSARLTLCKCWIQQILNIQSPPSNVGWLVGWLVWYKTCEFLHSLCAQSNSNSRGLTHFNSFCSAYCLFCSC